MENHLRALTLITALLGSLVSTQAQVISPSNYSLLSISGTWAYGQTDWNDIAGAGPVNNATDVAVVNGLLSDGYAFSPAAVGPVNGIYSAYPGFGFDTLVFTFNGALLSTSREFRFCPPVPTATQPCSASTIASAAVCG